MEIKLSQLASTYDNLQRIADRKFPVKLSYAINKNINFLRSEVVFYQNKIQELYDSYIEKDKKGNFIVLNETDGHISLKIKESMSEEFKNKMSELNEMTVNVDTYAIKLDVLLESGVDIEPAIIDSISFILEE